MARAAKRPCTYPGCGVLTETGRCDKHQHQVRKEQDAQRGTARERGYTRAWEKASKAFLVKHPLCMCEDCKAGEIRVTAAVLVDHKIPHRGDRTLFWDSSNWQSMAKPCHDKKTASVDGGFGNTGRAGSKV